MKIYVAGLLFALNVAKVFSANILCLMGVASPSHHIWNRVLMEALAENGHNLTIVSPDFEVNQPSNVNYIHLESVYDTVHEGPDSTGFEEMTKLNMIGIMKLFYIDFGIIQCEGILKSKGLDVIMNYPNDYKFDLVLYDFTCGPCLLGLLHKFNYPPLVSVTAFNNPPYTVDLIGGHKHYAYIPYYVLDYDVDMNFWQRIVNAFLYSVDSGYRNYFMLPKMDAMMRKRFDYKDMPFAGEMDKKTLLLLVNAHYSVDFPESVPPNLIPVGGLQIKEPKPLPEDINAFVEAGKKGSVLFSLGTNVRSDMLDKKRQQMFVDAFKQIPQYNFIWKFESDLGIKLPKNVMIRPWLPQNDILGHPKTKGFITHAGLLSTQESSWHGVPMIGIPFICDQYRNLQKSINAGVAEKIDFQTMTVEKVRDTVLQVLETPKYTENIQRRSSLFRDQSERPIDRAVWWVEWALRHPDATQLQSPTMKLGGFRGNLFDVMLFLIVILVAVVYFMRKIVKNLFGKSDNKVQSKKKNN